MTPGRIEGRGPRVLFFPNTDTLSHLTRALTLAGWLEAEGFEAHLGVSEPRLPWARRFAARCHPVRELWEPSGVPFPCFRWFRDENHVEGCVRSQEEVIRAVRPDLVVGIFDFVASTSAGRLPYLSVNGACMLPHFSGVLGFDNVPSESRDVQKRLFESFWRFSGRAFHRARAARGLREVRLATELLLGDANLLYEIPEICGEQPWPHSCRAVGPIFWEGWEHLGDRVPWEREPRRRTVYLNSGSLPAHDQLRHRVLERILATGARVLLSTGAEGPSLDSDQVYARPLLRPAEAAALADLVVCTGGVGACYSNLYHGVPSLVLPTQPEQATNGLHLARAGCGLVLMTNVLFSGNYADYTKALDLDRFGEALGRMLDAGRANADLTRVSRALRECRTAEHVVSCARSLV